MRLDGDSVKDVVSISSGSYALIVHLVLVDSLEEELLKSMALKLLARQHWLYMQ